MVADVLEEGEDVVLDMACEGAVDNEPAFPDMA